MTSYSLNCLVCVCVLDENRKYARYRDASYMGWVLKPRTPESGSYFSDPTFSLIALHCFPFLLGSAKQSPMKWVTRVKRVLPSGSAKCREYHGLHAAELVPMIGLAWGEKYGKRIREIGFPGLCSSLYMCQSPSCTWLGQQSQHTKKINFLLAPNISTLVL